MKQKNIVSILLFFLITLSFTLYPSPLFAQESTPSASPQTASDSGILSKIEDLKKEIASKAANLKAEINRKIGNKAFVGTITTMSTDSITLKTERESKTIKISEFTVYEDQTKQKTKKALKVESLVSSDHIITLGEVDEKGVMTAKKVIKIDPFIPKIFTYFPGYLTKIENNTVTLKTKTGIEQTLSLNPKTIIKNGETPLAISDLKQNQNAIIITTEKESSTAAYIHQIPETIKP